VEKNPERLLGFTWIDPNDQGAANEVRTAILKWKFKGIKLHMQITPSPISKLREVFQEAEKLSVPIVIHLAEGFDFLNDLSREYSVNVIVAHLGTGVYNLDPKRLEKALALSGNNENIYLETSGNTFFFVEHAVKRLGPSKIIFGSDFPHEHPLVVARAIDLLDLSSRDKDLILGRNISGLIGAH